jgi:hypothetical protein
MPGDLERLPARLHVSAAASGRAAEPGAGGAAGGRRWGEREQVLVSARVTRLLSARTRRAYAADVAAWLGWLTGREIDVRGPAVVVLDVLDAQGRLVVVAAGPVEDLADRPRRRITGQAHLYGPPDGGVGSPCAARRRAGKRDWTCWPDPRLRRFPASTGGGRAPVRSP